MPTSRKLRAYLEDYRGNRRPLVPDPGEGRHRTSYRLDPRLLYEGRQIAQARSNAGYVRQIIATYHPAVLSALQVVPARPAPAPPATPKPASTSREDLTLAARLRSTKRVPLDPYEMNKLSRKYGWGVGAQPGMVYYAESGEVICESGGQVLLRWRIPK